MPSFAQKHRFLLLSIAMLATLIAVGVVTYHFAALAEQEKLVERTQTVASALGASEIAQLSGDITDLDTPAYQLLKDRLIRIGVVNTDVVSVYVTGYRQGTVFFYADSVAEHDVDEAAPGLEYPEATPLFKSVFTEGNTTFEGPLADRWGTWASGLVPVLDPITGAVIAAVGMDIDGNVYRLRVVTRTAVPVSLLGMVFLLCFIVYFRYTKNKELLDLKSKFVSIASHELRSPISGIIWATESLKTTTAIDPDIKKTIELVGSTGRHLLSTVNEILNLSALEGAHVQKVTRGLVSMKALVVEIIESLVLVAQERDVEIVIDASLTDSVEIVCDREKTKRIVSNVLTNALKYSSKGGTVTIAYRAERGVPVVSVSDQGMGVPVSEESRIFKGDFRAGNAAQSEIAGSGMGLHLARELMERQGGTIRFESSAGKGTTFFIRFKP